MTTPAPAPAPAAGPSQKPKSSVFAWIFLVAFVGGLIALAVFYRDLFGSEVGGSCSSETDCKRGGVCISKKCYQGCETDGDCGAGKHCGSTEVSVTPGGNAAKGFKFDKVKICFDEKKKK